MLIQNILTRTFTNPDALKYQEQIQKHQSTFQDVSQIPIARGEHAIAINQIQYNVSEFDIAVQGNVNKLFQTPEHLLVIETDKNYDVLTPIVSIKDTNVSWFRFQKTQKGDTQMQKVVGTTFHNPPRYTQFEGKIDKKAQTPTLTGQAILLPEPDNKYDPNAVAVIAKLADGTAFKIGYLGKDTPLQKQIQKPVVAKLVIMAYSENGDLNDSYLVEVE